MVVAAREAIAGGIHFHGVSGNGELNRCCAGTWQSPRMFDNLVIIPRLIVWSTGMVTSEPGRSTYSWSAAPNDNDKEVNTTTTATTPRAAFLRCVIPVVYGERP